MKGARLVCATLLLAWAATGCKEPPASEPFQIYLRVESDPGKPVVGASVTRAAKTLATTDTFGRALLVLPGLEGESTDVLVRCPDGFQSPPKPVSIRLARLAEKNKVPEYAVSCPPTVRRIVVAVRADNGPNLPVVYLDKAWTRTDASGAAHFALEAQPGAQIRVTLDTGDRKDIKPQSPAKVFVVGPQDDIVTFEQRFEVDKKAPVVVRPNVPRPIN